MSEEEKEKLAKTAHGFIDFLDGITNTTSEEKTADKMFEELGYKKYDNHPEEDEQKIKPNKWVTQDCRIIEYSQQDTINDYIYTLCIRFHIEGKRIEIRGSKKPKEIRTMSLNIPAILNAQELQAINEKCKELGWL